MASLFCALSKFVRRKRGTNERHLFTKHNRYDTFTRRLLQYMTVYTEPTEKISAPLSLEFSTCPPADWTERRSAYDTFSTKRRIFKHVRKFLILACRKRHLVKSRQRGKRLFMFHFCCCEYQGDASMYSSGGPLDASTTSVPHVSSRRVTTRTRVPASRNSVHAVLDTIIVYNPLIFALSARSTSVTSDAASLRNHDCEIGFVRHLRVVQMGFTAGSYFSV